MTQSKIKIDQLELENFVANAGGGLGLYPPLSYQSKTIQSGDTELIVGSNNTGSNAPSGAHSILNFRYPSYGDPSGLGTGDSLRGKYLEVYMNGQRLTNGVDYKEEYWNLPTDSQPYNVQKIYYIGQYLPEIGDNIVFIVPTCLNYDQPYIPQTASFTFSGNVTYSSVFDISKACSATPGAPYNAMGSGYGAINEGIPFFYLTGGYSSGKSLAVFLNGVRLFPGQDYTEPLAGNTGSIRDAKIQFNSSYSNWQANDHLFFQTVSTGSITLSNNSVSGDYFYSQEIWIVPSDQNVSVNHPLTTMSYRTGGADTNKYLHVYLNGQRLIPTSIVSGQGYTETDATHVTFPANYLKQDDVVSFIVGVPGSSQNITTVPVSGIISNTLKAANGYTDLPGGLILQWGSAYVNAGSGLAITFPKPFGTFLNATTSFVNSGGISGSAAGGYGLATPTGMTLFNNGSAGASTISWQAIGY